MSSPGDGPKNWKPRGYEDCELIAEDCMKGDDTVGVPDLVTRAWLHVPSRTLTIVQTCEPNYFNSPPDTVRLDLSAARTISQAIARLPE